MMPRTSNIYARIEPELKAQAEEILGQLGIPMSNAIALFLRQVVLQGGIPFDLKLPRNKPASLGSLHEDDVNKLIEKGFDDLEQGRTIPADTVAENIRREYNIK